MTRPKVVQLLRAAVGVVTIVVSRQEDADEATDEVRSCTHTHVQQHTHNLHTCM